VSPISAAAVTAAVPAVAAAIPTAAFIVSGCAVIGLHASADPGFGVVKRVVAIVHNRVFQNVAGKGFTFGSQIVQMPAKKGQGLIGIGQKLSPLIRLNGRSALVIVGGEIGRAHV
jgi:hypothetical protein